jgi:hypothetical protein
VQPVAMRKATCAAQAHMERREYMVGGTSQACVPLPYFSVLRMLKAVNTIDPSHPGRRRACEDVRIVIRT